MFWLTIRVFLDGCKTKDDSLRFVVFLTTLPYHHPARSNLEFHALPYLRVDLIFESPKRSWIVIGSASASRPRAAIR